MTPEGKVKKEVKSILKEFGAWYCMPVQTGRGEAGLPDFIVCYKGYFLGIECKADGGGLTALQMAALKRIDIAGGSTLVIFPANIGDLRFTLTALS